MSPSPTLREEIAKAVKEIWAERFNDRVDAIMEIIERRLDPETLARVLWGTPKRRWNGDDKAWIMTGSPDYEAMTAALRAHVLGGER